MDTKHGLSLKQVISVALMTELTLMLIQLLSLKFYCMGKTDAAFSFTSEYMMSTGFYVFLVGGFFLYLFVVSTLVQRITEGIISKVLAIIVVAGICEAIFYLSIPASFEFVFAYSIFSKLFASAFGVIVFNVSHDHVRKPESYF